MNKNISFSFKLKWQIFQYVFWVVCGWRSQRGHNLPTYKLIYPSIGVKKLDALSTTSEWRHLGSLFFVEWDLVVNRFQDIIDSEGFY